MAKRLKAKAKCEPKRRIDRAALESKKVRASFASEVASRVEALGEGADFAKVDKVLREVAEETLTAKKRGQPGWFADAECAILTACATRNAAFKRWARAGRGPRSDGLALRTVLTVFARPCNAGAGVFFAEDDDRNISQPLREDENQTNNRGELTAIILALMAREEELARGDTVVPIGTDSQYSIRLAGRDGRVMRARGWKTSRGKPAKNVDLIKILLAWMAAYGSHIRFVHIYSHTGKGDPLSIGNDGADRMAVAGAKAGRGNQATILRIALRRPETAHDNNN